MLAADGGGGGGGGSGSGGDGGSGDVTGGEPTLPPDLQAMLDEANRVQGKSLLSIILEAGGEILKELLGINDILNCFQKGDIVACISIVANIIPWGKIFKLPKIVKAIERAWSAVQAFWEKLRWARRIIEQVNEFKAMARAAAREAAERAAAAARAAAERAAKAAKEAAERAAAAARRAAEKLKNKVDDAAETCAKKSFVPGTAVLLADGTTKPIEAVAPGDRVLATDPQTGETEAKAVTTKRESTGDKLVVGVTLDVDGDSGDRTATVTATDNHPWWLPDQGRWLTSLELRQGDALLTPDGSRVRVVAVVAHGARLTVHNLTVADIHTYYVMAGTTPVLVHNCKGGVNAQGQPCSCNVRGNNSSGYSFESQYGMDREPKVDIPSATGTATHRTPDLTRPTFILDAKNTKYLRAKDQIIDMAEYAAANNMDFAILVRQHTRLSPAMRGMVRAGLVLIFRVP
jgi:hypothetical protein